MNASIPEMMTDVTVFCRAQKGNLRAFRFQYCQIWHLSEGTHSPFLLFEKSLFKCLKGGVLCHGADTTKIEMKHIKTMDGVLQRTLTSLLLSLE